MTDRREKARWIVELVGKDLSRLSAAELLPDRIKLHEFAYQDIPQTTRNTAFVFPSPNELEVISAEQGIMAASKRLTLQIQRETKEGMDLLSSGHRWTVFGDTRVKRNSRAPSFALWPTAKRGVVKSYAGTLREMILWTVVDLFAEFWRDVRRCAWGKCGAYFLRHRKQVYCQHDHRQKANWERFVERHRPKQLRK